MSRFAVVLIASLAFLGVTVSAQEGQTFTGEITDTHCAMLGSHDMMKKAEGFKSDLECVLYCVKYQKSGSMSCLTHKPRQFISWMIRRWLNPMRQKR